MKILNTNFTLEELLDQMPIGVQYVDKDGFLRYHNRVAASRPAHARREVGVNIHDCHARLESLEAIERLFDDFRRGRKEPQFYITSTGYKSIFVPIFDPVGDFAGVLSYRHPVDPELISEVVEINDARDKKGVSFQLEKYPYKGR